MFLVTKPYKQTNTPFMVIDLYHLQLLYTAQYCLYQLLLFQKFKSVKEQRYPHINLKFYFSRWGYNTIALYNQTIEMEAEKGFITFLRRFLRYTQGQTYELLRVILENPSIKSEFFEVSINEQDLSLRIYAGKAIKLILESHLSNRIILSEDDIVTSIQYLQLRQGIVQSLGMQNSNISATQVSLYRDIYYLMNNIQFEMRQARLRVQVEDIYRGFREEKEEVYKEEEKRGFKEENEYEYEYEKQEIREFKEEKEEEYEKKEQMEIQFPIIQSDRCRLSTKREQTKSRKQSQKKRFTEKNQMSKRESER